MSTPKGIARLRARGAVAGVVTVVMLVAVVRPLCAQGAGKDPAAVFAAGQRALAAGDLATAEADFQAVLRADTGSAPALINLGVVAMRRRQWAAARRLFARAAPLAPAEDQAGLQLDVGLSYFRQGDYRAARAPLRAALARRPDSTQARYLLGLCSFFTADYASAVRYLAPLWPVAKDQLNYLYVLGVAADNAGRGANDVALRDRAMGRLVTIGRDSPLFHLLMGKAYLNRGQNARAETELLAALRGDPKLPMAHFNLGVVYQREHKFDQAAAQFRRDIALEPDVAYNYDHLGVVLGDLNQDDAAVANFRAALRRDPTLATSYFGLGKIYERQGRHALAITALEQAVRLSPKSASAHNLLAQALLRAGRRADAQRQFALASGLQKAVADQLQREISGEALPSGVVAP